MVVLGSNRKSYPGLFCYDTYTKLRDHNTVFSGLLARNWWEFYFSADGSTEVQNVELVSGNYFQVLGVNAYIGRTLTPEDDAAPGTRAVAVLSYDFWSSRFGSDPGALGKTVFIQGQPFTIVGVTPPGFFGVNSGIAQPIRVPWSMAEVLRPRSEWNVFDEPGLGHAEVFQIMGRLKPGVSEEQAQAALDPLFNSIRQSHADAVKWTTPAARQQFLVRRVAMSPLGSGYAGLKVRFSQPLKVLMALVGILLLIACTALANLLLARNSTRHREMAVRLALGARRARVIQQLLIESVLVAVAGGALGVMIAWFGAGALVSALGNSASPEFIRTNLGLRVSPDGTVLAFTLAVSIVTAVLFGLVPSFYASHTPLIDTLKGTTTGLGVRPSHMTLRKGLIAGQVALCLFLVTAAGLFVRTLRSLKNVATGVDVSHLVQIPINPDPYRHLTEPQKYAYYRELQQRIETLPGVRSVARSQGLLFANDIGSWDTGLEEGESGEGENFRVTSNTVSSNFFETVGIPVTEGRVWTAEDDYRPTREAVVSQSFARYFFADRSPLGHVLTSWKDKRKYVIIGVVGDAKYGDLHNDDPRAVYYPAAEFRAENLILRTPGNPAGLLRALEREAKSLGSEAYVYPPKTLEQQTDELLVQERLVAWLSGFFGLFAALLAAIGLYGVIAFSVSRRTNEIGLRVALGATRVQIGSLVLREVLTLAAIGTALGVPAVMAFSRTTASLLFGVSPTDPLTIGGSAFLMCVIGVVAGCLPARRAARLDPMDALRHD
jgi:predicted permease